CSNEHAECRKGSDDAWIPSRLIDIHDYRSSGQVRIVSRNDIELSQFGEQPRYTTLSHVWGTHTFLTLVHSNLQNLRSGFPVSGLPKTFTQAIAVTEKIGLRYLWIDSLCIIQDSAEDWRVEAGSMDKVYLNSFCTIAASLAANPNEGLFWDRNAELSKPFAVQFMSPPRPTQFRVFLDLQFLILDHSPLYKRGWVLQESLLSPRTMHFSKLPAFECREIFACESYRTTGAKSASADLLYRTRKTIARAEEFTYSNWCGIVFDYSRCNLTKGTDKLIALCGIAKVVSSVIPGGYFAGIWAEWWLQGLLWMVDRGEELAPIRPWEEYRGISVLSRVLL
ncbi:HET-domain-containing protein, partial [Lentithecium fluviatile CBS 122367]